MAVPEACDVVVAGGGPVGAALALSLRGCGLTVALVEPRARPTATFRPIALSYGSRLILEQLGAFHEAKYSAIKTIHVSQAGGFGRTVMRASDEALPALGYVCDAGELAAALLEHAAAEHVAGCVTAWHETRERVRVTIATPEARRESHARLLVLADGALHVGDDLAVRDYGQTAIVARVRSEVALSSTAFERFTSDGPLALLPWQDGYGLVWAMMNTQADELAQLSGERFLAALGARFGTRLGRFVDAGPRAAHALRLWFRRSNMVAPRVVAVGNAAQTLHPVAGQGLNLGLRDARVLADLVRSTKRDSIGGSEFAAAFQSRRRHDRLSAIRTTDSLVRLFSNDHGWLRTARGIGLATLDIIPAARTLLAHTMMFGVRDEH